MAQPVYPQALPLQAIARHLAQATAHPAHRFVADDYRLLDAGHLNWHTLLGHRQITDSYLLGLAVRHHYRLVTFDAHINPDVVIGTSPQHWVTL